MSKRSVLARLAKLLGPPMLAASLRPRADAGLSHQLAAPSSGLQGIHEIHTEIERTARLGHIPAEALTIALKHRHLAQLDEEKSRRDELEQAQEAVLRRLDAAYPAPIPPAPEPPAPARPRTFIRMGKIFGDGTATRH